MGWDLVIQVRGIEATSEQFLAELVPIPFESLLRRIYYEYTRNDAIFDLPSRKFYRPSSEVDLSVSFCGNPAGNPVGPAAGPHTQLAQNIVPVMSLVGQASGAYAEQDQPVLPVTH